MSACGVRTTRAAWMGREVLTLRRDLDRIKGNRPRPRRRATPRARLANAERLLAGRELLVRLAHEHRERFEAALVETDDPFDRAHSVTANGKLLPAALVVSDGRVVPDRLVIGRSQPRHYPPSQTVSTVVVTRGVERVVRMGFDSAADAAATDQRRVGVETFNRFMLPARPMAEARDMALDRMSADRMHAAVRGSRSAPSKSDRAADVWAASRGVELPREA